MGISLDKARQDGPEAVLAFVADQPNPSLPLLEAARNDALNDLSASLQPVPEAPTVSRVSLNNGPCAFDTIQEAITAAASGDTVRVATGVYTESLDITGKTVTIEGGYDSACAALTNPLGVTRITASVVGSVVDITGGSVVTLNNLNLTGGTSFGAGVDVLGSSRVILNNTDVHDNAGASGGGLYIAGSSVITYTNDSDIYNNSGTAGGGAIVYGRLVGSSTTSDIYFNSSTTDGGGIYVAGGRVVLDNADVVANSATNFGGGIFLNTSAAITLTNSVFVGETAPCCQTATAGGGIYANASRIYLGNPTTSVLNNTASGNGGGVFLTGGSRLDVAGANIGSSVFSTGGNDAVLGAGIYAESSTILFEGRIINNIASNSGGGIYATNSTITMTQTTIGGLGANEHNQIGATGLNGAGMYLINNSRAWMDNTTVISNTMSNPATGYAGGIYVRAGSAITMTNSRVEQHFLPSITDGRGAGMYIYDSTATLSNTQVMSNTASDLGGGARLFGTSTLNLLNGTEFINNKALGGEGGGIAAVNTPTIQVTDTRFRANSASENGGAITTILPIQIDHSQFTNNTAGLSGGGLYAGGAATIVDSVFAGNSAGSFGGGLLLGAPGSEITNTTFSGNSANMGGGAYNSGGPTSSLLNATFANNSAVTSGGSLGAVFQLKNTILAGGTPHNCDTPAVSLGSNLESGAACGLNATGDLSNADALLGPLGHNGGNTLTHALLIGSPAIDTADDPACPAADQRGVARPLDGDGNGEPLCDRGAYEAPDYVALTGLVISGPTQGATLTGYSFTADSNPITATVPISYSWQATGQSLVTHTGGLSDSILYSWPTPGEKVITVTASSGLGSVFNTFTVNIDTPISGLAAANDSPTQLSSPTTFTATLSAGTNATFTWIFGDSSPFLEGQVVNHTYAATGVYTATVIASNAAGTQLTNTTVTVIASTSSLYLPVLMLNAPVYHSPEPRKLP